jgi:hypothetical protein
MTISFSKHGVYLPGHLLAIRSGNAEVQKVFLQNVDARSVDFIAVEDIAHVFAQTDQLSQATRRCA